jgi:hypothetical protein
LTPLKELLTTTPLRELDGCCGLAPVLTDIATFFTASSYAYFLSLLAAMLCFFGFCSSVYIIFGVTSRKISISFTLGYFSISLAVALG